MKKVTVFNIVGIVLLFSINSITAQSEKKYSDSADTVFGRGVKINNGNFTGTVYLKMLVNADKDNPITAGNVTFEPGARTKWHLHPAGQIILAVDGKGYYQEKGKSKRVVHKGDVIKCPPNIEHWHGASEDSYFVQIAVGNNDKGAVVWLAPVTDKEYSDEAKE